MVYTKQIVLWWEWEEAWNARLNKLRKLKPNLVALLTTLKKYCNYYFGKLKNDGYI